MKRIFIVVLIALFIGLLDQYTKYLAIQHLLFHQPVAIFPGFNLTLTFNAGAAFNLLSEAGGWQRWLFVFAAVFISGLIISWLWRLPPGHYLLTSALTLILGGAIGNLYDRLTMGYVTDFLDFYIGQWHWPAFNLADTAISMGILLFLLDMFFEHQNNKGKN